MEQTLKIQTLGRVMLNCRNRIGEAKLRQREEIKRRRELAAISFRRILCSGPVSLEFVEVNA